MTAAEMTTYITVRAAFLFKDHDEFSDHLGVIPRDMIFQGKSLESGFIETRVKDIAGEIKDISQEIKDMPEALVYIDEARARKALVAPEPIAPDELGIFCTLVTRFARDIGTDRDYLMAVAYCGTEKLTKLGNAGDDRVGPFQFTKEEWDTAITTGPAKDRQFSPEDRFRWNSQAEVAALLAADCTMQLKTDAALGRDPTFAELYFAQLFGSGADKTLKSQRTDACPEPAAGTRAAELALVSGNATIGDVLTGLQERLAAGYAAALEVIDVQPPEIRIFRVQDQGDPPWLAIAQNEMARGVSELPGGRNSEEIKVYLAATGVDDLGDDTAWCGAFATFCMKKSGLQDVQNSVKTPDSARAAWWKKWGRTADDPSRPGTVVVLRPQSPKSSGHVGFLVEESGGKVQLLAGNQGGHGGPDRVSVVPFSTGEVVERRWLDVAPLPAAIGGLDARSLLHRGVTAEAGDSPFIQKAPVVMNNLMGVFPDLTVEQAAAILGNIGQECGGFTQLEQTGGGGRGWCQWDGDRRTAFFKFADDRGLSHESDEANFGYLVDELRVSQKPAFDALKRERILENAVITFNDRFEKSRTPMMDKRIRYAQIALEAFKNSSA